VSPSLKRDPEETADALAGVLAEHVAVSDVTVTDLTVPKAGFSNETIFFHASWSQDGHQTHRDLVLRVEPTDHQLFVRPDAPRQARMMSELARHPGVPVPKVVLTVLEPDLLGAAFFVMERAHGRVPGDVPSWHQKGWTVDLSPGDRARMHDAALESLVALHQIEPGDGFPFLRPSPGDTRPALDRYLDDLQQWFDWCGPSRRFGVEVLDAALAYLLDNRPKDRTEGLVWGDARVGNMVFADDLSVAALLDWEGATLGPPGIDLGWWLMFEDFLCEAQGLDRLAGVPDRAGIIARYHELGGADVDDVAWYELVACVVMTLINSRLADLLVAGGQVPEPVAATYPMRTVKMTRLRLAALSTAPG
jgi:aminoglycoside phosphotransferase (APT) family kinase protein